MAALPDHKEQHAHIILCIVTNGVALCVFNRYTRCAQGAGVTDTRALHRMRPSQATSREAAAGVLQCIL